MENEPILFREPRPDVVIKRQVQGAKRVIRLKKDLTVKIHLVDKRIFSAHNSELMCFAGGDTPEEALAEFGLLFDRIWSFLGPKNADELHRNARNVRAHYVSFIREEGD